MDEPYRDWVPPDELLLKRIREAERAGLHKYRVAAGFGAVIVLVICAALLMLLLVPVSNIYVNVQFPTRLDFELLRENYVSYLKYTQSVKGTQPHRYPRGYTGPLSRDRYLANEREPADPVLLAAVRALQRERAQVVYRYQLAGTDEEQERMLSRYMEVSQELHHLEDQVVTQQRAQLHGRLLLYALVMSCTSGAVAALSIHLPLLRKAKRTYQRFTGSLLVCGAVCNGRVNRKKAKKNWREGFPEWAAPHADWEQQYLSWTKQRLDRFEQRHKRAGLPAFTHMLILETDTGMVVEHPVNTLIYRAVEDGTHLVLATPDDGEEPPRRAYFGMRMSWVGQGAETPPGTVQAEPGPSAEDGAAAQTAGADNTPQA